MLKHLFSPFTINGKELKNRCVVPAMVTNYCNVDGTCTETFVAYHEARVCLQTLFTKRGKSG